MKNSREAIQYLVSITNSTHLIVDKEHLAYANSADLAIPIVPFEDFTKLPDLEMDDGLGFGSISAEQRAREIVLPAFYLHTSGSTGHPKIISHVSLKIAIFDCVMNLISLINSGELIGTLVRLKLQV